MRVLLVSDGYPPTPGGLESHVQRLARYLHFAGHIPTVVAVDGGQSESWEVIPASTLLGRVPALFRNKSRGLPPPWPDPILGSVIESAVRDSGSEIIHAHGWCSSSASRTASHMSMPLVVTLHDYGLLCPMRTLLNGGGLCSHTAGPRCAYCKGSDQPTPKRVALGIGLRFGRPKSSTYLAVSNAVADIHRARGISQPIEVVPNFLDLPADLPTATPKDGPVLYVGPSNEAKGFFVVSEAHRLLIARGHEVTLRHVGGDDVSEAPFVTNSCRLEGSDINAAYRSSRMVVVPSIWEEPCPTVALEAMASGRAVVASRIGGLTDIVDHGVTGLLVRPNHPGALADAIESLLDDPKLNEAMGVAGRERFIERFSTERVGPMIEHVYATAFK